MEIKNSIKKLFNRKYIRREKIKDAIMKARNDEAARLKKIHGGEVEDVIEQMDSDRHIEVDSIRAEMEKMTKENDELRKRNKEVEKLYFKTINRAKENEKITREMSKRAMELENFIGGVTGLIHGISGIAADHLNKIERQENKDRKTLGIIKKGE